MHAPRAKYWWQPPLHVDPGEVHAGRGHVLRVGAHGVIAAAHGEERDAHGAVPVGAEPVALDAPGHGDARDEARVRDAHVEHREVVGRASAAFGAARRTSALSQRAPSGGPHRVAPGAVPREHRALGVREAAQGVIHREGPEGVEGGAHVEHAGVAHGRGQGVGRVGERVAHVVRRDGDPPVRREVPHEKGAGGPEALVPVGVDVHRVSARVRGRRGRRVGERHHVAKDQRVGGVRALSGQRRVPRVQRDRARRGAPARGVRVGPAAVAHAKAAGLIDGPGERIAGRRLDDAAGGIGRDHRVDGARSVGDGRVGGARDVDDGGVGGGGRGRGAPREEREGERGHGAHGVFSRHHPDVLNFAVNPRGRSSAWARVTSHPRMKLHGAACRATGSRAVSPLSPAGHPPRSCRSDGDAG